MKMTNKRLEKEISSLKSKPPDGVSFVSVIDSPAG
jgi:hypothetical protein